MNQEKVWEDFAALPVEAQQQVVDFITFLRTRYKQLPTEERTGLTDLTDETFGCEMSVVR